LGCHQIYPFPHKTQRLTLHLDLARLSTPNPQDTRGSASILCQALVEVKSQGEQMVQTVLLGGFGALFVGLIAAGVFFDPVQ